MLSSNGTLIIREITPLGSGLFFIYKNEKNGYKKNINVYNVISHEWDMTTNESEE